jgi:hypothetical protein
MHMLVIKGTKSAINRKSKNYRANFLNTCSFLNKIISKEQESKLPRIKKPNGKKTRNDMHKINQIRLLKQSGNPDANSQYMGSLCGQNRDNQGQKMHIQDKIRLVVKLRLNHKKIEA